MGFAYGELKKYPAAAASYEKAIKNGNHDPQVVYNLAHAYGKLGKTQEATKLYEQYAARHPNRDVLNVLAEFYMQEKLYDKAISAYRRLLKLDPDKASVYANLGHAYALKGDADRAIESYRLSLKHDAEDDVVYVNLGMAYEKKGMFTEALNAYKTAYELNPESKKAAARYREIRIKMLQQSRG
jgi:tetratricopeptide (TPR) repeat protein